MDEYDISVALDLGTGGTTYAVCLTSDPSNPSAGQSLYGSKPPTAIVLDPKGGVDALGKPCEPKVVSFGWKAHETWYQSCSMSPDNLSPFYFFNLFKMCLYGDIDKRPIIYDAQNRPLMARTVMAAALRQLKEDILVGMQDTTFALEERPIEDRIGWKLLVPAIWTPAARQLMREAGLDAGLYTLAKPGKLQIVLEPEAASVYCQVTVSKLLAPGLSAAATSSFSVVKDKAKRESLASTFYNGKPFAVFDMGSGTFDTAIHSRNKNGTLTEICAPRGNNFGSSCINIDFQALLRDIFGGPLIDAFAKQFPVKWFDILGCFELQKLEPIASDKQKKKGEEAEGARTPTIMRRIALPREFLEHVAKLNVATCLENFFKRSQQWKIKSMVAKLNRLWFKPAAAEGKEENKEEEKSFGFLGLFEKEDIVVNRDDLKFSEVVMKALFKRSVDGILGTIATIKELDLCDVVFLTGGYASSDYLRDQIQAALPAKTLVRPQHPHLAIVLGAAMYGANPLIIQDRVAPFTIGYQTGVPWNDADHEGKEKTVVKRLGVMVPYCTDMFQKFVAVGTRMAAGQCVTFLCTPLRDGQTSCHVAIFIEEKDPNPTFIQTCKPAGSLTVPMPDITGGLSRQVEVSMFFGDTEIRVHCRDLTSMIQRDLSIDFFGEPITDSFAAVPAVE